MGRPPKQTIDYFPHYTKQGKTIYILEKKYGNDGYAFWFKTLELLGATDGHAYNMNDANAREYLWAHTNVTEDTGNNILTTCAELGAVDAKLFKKGVIWSDNFIHNLTHLYSKRMSELPVKPVSGDINPVSGGRKPQSKVKYSKVKYSEDFLSFWNAYPRKTAKSTAFQSWGKHVDVPLDEILKAVDAQKKTEQWKDPQFIPMPATWLNQRRWEDEVEIKKEQGGYQHQ
jgi:hypothetical protein